MRELSVVVIGVAITFFASSWVTNHREKKELRGHLSAVKIELESNLEMVRSNFDYYDRLVDFSFYLQSRSLEELTLEEITHAATTPDGVNVMNRIYYYMPVETVSFEAMKQSGTAKHIHDQNVWRAIMKSYKSLEELKHENDTYMNIKIDYFYNILRDGSLDKKQWAISLPEYNFYRATYTFHHVFDKVFENVGEALSYL